LPILVSVPGYLLVPEIEMELEPQFDLEKEFNHNRVWFFVILGAMGVTSFVESAVSASASKLSFGSAFPLLVIVLCIGGIVFRSRWAQLLVASTFLTTLLCYIGFVFLRL
jgi:predicted membrane channel-forming protein YqfA (hemolysin III family)